MPYLAIECHKTQQEEEPTNWSKKEVTETLNKSIPLTCLDALERAVIAKLLSPSFLQQERLCIHILGATSEAEGISDYKVCMFPHSIPSSSPCASA